MKSEVTISDIRLKKPGGLNPLIVEFQNGEIAQENYLKTTLFPHEKLTQKVIEVLSGNGHTYTNKVHKETTFGSTFIGIRNRKTNKIRLVEAQHVTLINTLYLESDFQENVVDSKDVQDVKHQVATLKKMFGTKKSVRYFEQSEAFEVDNSHIENQIHEVLENSIIPKTSFTINEDSHGTSDIAPTCNRNANNVSEIYKVDDFLNEQELSSLMHEVNNVLNNDDKKEHSDFLRNFLAVARQNSSNLHVKTACLLYADCILNFLKAPRKDLSKLINTICPYSQSVSNKITSMFCIKTKSTINRSLLMKDKSICYVIVLILLACDFKVNLEHLAKLSDYGYKKMKQLGRLVGVVPSGKGSDVHILKLPLPPPQKLTKATKKKN